MSPYELVASLFKAYFGFGLRDRIKQIDSTLTVNPDYMKLLYGKAYDTNLSYKETIKEFTEYWFKGFKEAEADPWDWFLFFVKDAKEFVKPLLSVAPLRDKKFILQRVNMADNQYKEMCEVTIPKMKLSLEEWGGLSKEAKSIDITDDLYKGY